MEVFNVTRERVVAPRVRESRGIFSQMIGLIGRKEFPPGDGLWLPLCNGVHSAFLRFPIDVIFTDANHRVVGIVQGLKPWRATNFFLKARNTLELPAGTVAASGTEVGDQLRIGPGDEKIEDCSDHRNSHPEVAP